MARQIVDPKAPDSVVRITDFPGMSPGTDQHDNHPGLSWFQINAVSLFPGELRARRGFQVIRFDQPVRPTFLAVTAASTYVLSPVPSGSLRSDHDVVASSTYIVSSNVSTSGGFSLLGMI